MDPLTYLSWPTLPWKRLCRVPRELKPVTDRAAEVAPRDVGLSRAGIERIWQSAEALYRTGLYPALQLCVRHRGAVLLDRAIGHAEGNAPSDSPDTPKRPATTDTPFRIYSASKAVTAMVVHLLDDRGVLHIDDRVCDYLPEFERGARAGITIAHVLCHRAGIPNPPPAAMDLDLVARPDELVKMLAEIPLVGRPGRQLAYHAVTGGFVLGEVVRRATGQDIRSVLTKEIREPLGLRWMNYGVADEDAALVAHDAITGVPPPPPFAQLFTRALGVPVEQVLELAHDPRFLAGILPAANVVSNARDLSAFFECLRCGGESNGTRVFEPRTVRRATAERSYFEVDLTLGIPLRYGLGFMLGGKWLSLFGPDTEHAFGHLGFTNVIAWADPERELSAALVTSGKPFLDIEVVRFYQCLMAIGREIPQASMSTGLRARPVWLIRHAESEWNAQGRWQGQRDPALSERGRDQAQQLATSLAAAGIGAIVASDLARARETAAMLGAATGVGVALDSRLRERDLGIWSGLTSVEIAARWPDDLARLRAQDPELRPGGGESLHALHARVANFVAWLERQPGHGAIAVVTHAGVLRALGLAPAPGNATARSVTIGALHATLRTDGAHCAAPFPLREEEERL